MVTSGKVVRGASLTKASLWGEGGAVSLCWTTRCYGCFYKPSTAQPRAAREQPRRRLIRFRPRCCNGTECLLDE